jgi:hypothetical protein
MDYTTNTQPLAEQKENMHSSSGTTPLETLQITVGSRSNFSAESQGRGSCDSPKCIPGKPLYQITVDLAGIFTIHSLLSLPAEKQLVLDPVNRQVSRCQKIPRPIQSSETA